MRQTGAFCKLILCPAPLLSIRGYNRENILHLHHSFTCVLRKLYFDKSLRFNHLYRIILTINTTTKEGELWSGKAVFSSDTARHHEKFIRHCMRLWSSTFGNMASQNLSSDTTADLTVLQRQQSKKQSVSTQK